MALYPSFKEDTVILPPSNLCLLEPGWRGVDRQGAAEVAYGKKLGMKVVEVKEIGNVRG